MSALATGPTLPNFLRSIRNAEIRTILDHYGKDTRAAVLPRCSKWHELKNRTRGAPHTKSCSHVLPNFLRESVCPLFSLQVPLVNVVRSMFVFW